MMMNVKKLRNFTLAILGLAIFIYIIVWLLFVNFYRIGGGRYAYSPNDRFKANATLYEEANFWGDKSHYFEFSISSNEGDRESLKTVRLERIPTDLDQEVMNIRHHEDLINWADDSNSVTFRYEDFELKLLVDSPQTDSQN